MTLLTSYIEKTLIEGNNMKDLDEVQIIKKNNKPQFAVLDYGLFERMKEILEDYMDHLHSESVLKRTKKDDWVDLSSLKQQLGIK